MVLDIDLRKYFTPAAVAKTLQGLPPISTPVMDLVYPESARVNHPLPVIGADEISKVVKNAPVVKRGTRAVPVGGASEAITYIEPQPVEVSSFVDGVALNNLKMLLATGNEQSIQVYVNNKIDYLRQTCRKTAEAIAAQSLTGTISYPMKTEAGFDTYTVAFGSTLEFVPAKLWSANDATIEEILMDLIKIGKLIKEQGFGTKIRYLAGSTAYIKLAAKVIALADSGTVSAKVTDQAIQIAGFTIELFNGTYVDPSDGSVEDVVPATKICAVAVDAPFTFYYCALDDIDAGLLPMPFYASPEKKKNPSGIEVVGKSKPLPVPVTKAICWATVTA